MQFVPRQAVLCRADRIAQSKTKTKCFVQPDEVKPSDGWQGYSFDGSFLGKDADQTNRALHRLSDYEQFP